MQANHTTYGTYLIDMLRLKPELNTKHYVLGQDYFQQGYVGRWRWTSAHHMGALTVREQLIGRSTISYVYVCTGKCCLHMDIF